jgi:peptidoglycan/xylan/chitin deacetylase (PgdA/CDA1 family)
VLLGVLPSTTSRIDYTAIGGTTFTFGFKVTDTSHIKVFVDADGAGTASTFVEQTTGITKSLDPVVGGGVVFAVAPTPGATVRIERTVPVTQDSLWTPYSAFKAKTLEGQLDYRGMVDQQLDRTTGDLAAKDAVLGAKDAALQAEIDAEEATRAAADTVEASARITGDSEVRTYVESVVTGQYAGTGVVPAEWTATGDGTTVRFATPGSTLFSPSMYLVTLSGVVQKAMADYTVDLGTHEIVFTIAPALGVPISVRSTGYSLGVNEGDNSLVTASGSTTARTLAARFSDVVNVRDNALACDGATDDTAALTALLARLGTTPATIVVPGPCVVNSNVTIPAVQPVRMEGNGAFVGTGIVTYQPWGVTGASAPTVRRLAATLAHDFTQSGTYTLDAGSSATGASVSHDATRGAAKLAFTAAAVNQYTGAVATGTWDFSASDRFTIEVGFPKADYNSRITVILVSDVAGLANYANVTYQPQGHQSRFTLSIAKSAMGVVGAPNWAAIRRIEVRYQRYTAATTAGEMYLYGAWSHVSARPKVLLTFDDSLAGVQTEIVPRLTAAGMRATLYALPSKIGTAGYLTLAQLQTLYAAGWDIASHTNTHTRLAAIPATYSRVGTVATLTLASNVAHGKIVGNTITVAGADEADFNGTFTVASVPNTYTVTFNVAGTSGDLNGQGFVYIVGFTPTSRVRAEVGAAQEWLESKGFTRSARHFAYPYGQWDPDVVTVLRDEFGVLTARATASYNGSNYLQHTITGAWNPHVLPSYSIDQRTAATVLVRVDDAISTNSTVILIGHDLAASAPSESQMLTSEFQILIDGLKTRRDAGQIDVVTISEWFNRL